MACLKVSGTQPKLRQEFNKTRSKGPIVQRTSFNNLVGKMSKGQFVVLICWMTSVRRESETGSKQSNTAGWVAFTDTSVLTLQLVYCRTDITLSI